MIESIEGRYERMNGDNTEMIPKEKKRKKGENEWIHGDAKKTTTQKVVKVCICDYLSVPNSSYEK
jgi:hypothetical protein